MRTGIIRGEPIDRYHSTDAASHSKLEILRDRDRGTLKYFGRFIAKHAEETPHADHFDVGSGIDALLLEGDEAFKSRVWTAPEGFRWQTAEGKALVEAKRRAGKIVLSAEEAETVFALRAACHRNSTLMALLSVGEPQVTLRHGFERFAVQVRPDWLNQGIVTLPDGSTVGPYMVDLKSAEDLTRFYKFLPGYYRQCALYCEVYRLVMAKEKGVSVEEVSAPEWFWAVCFKSQPMCAVVYGTDPERLAAATEEVVDDLRLLKSCYDTGNWSAFTQGVQQLQPLRRVG
jgi:hypothetical protein